MAPSPVINLDRELDRLFQAPFAEFVGARNGVAAMLKKAGRADESARVRGLAKPSYTAWLVNQLYWNARDLLDAFLKASDRVRAAEQALLEGRKAANHAELVSARAAALDQLMSRASTRAAEEGTPLSPALGERLKTTLEAIGAFGSSDGRHARGRLQEDLDPPGFAAFAALAGMAKPAPGGARKAPAPAPAEPPRLVVGRSVGLDQDARQAAAEARAALHEAQASAARAQDASTAAAEAERKARLAVDAAKARLAEVQRAVKSAEAEVAATTAAFKARQAEARKAALAAAAAEKALDKARAKIADDERQPQDTRQNARSYRSAARLRAFWTSYLVVNVVIKSPTSADRASRCTPVALLPDAPRASRARGCHGTDRRRRARACSRACTAC